MKVILLKELKGKGGEGDVIDVAPGFANNYLLPQNYAIKATKGNLKQLEQRKHNIAKREEVRLADAHKLQEKLEGKKIPVVAQVGEEGQLFGSVTTQMISDAIKETLALDVDRRRIDLGRPIKVAGDHQVSISIYRDVKAMVDVVVGSEESFASTEDAEAATEAITGTPESEETIEVIEMEIEKAETPTEEAAE